MESTNDTSVPTKWGPTAPIPPLPQGISTLVSGLSHSMKNMQNDECNSVYFNSQPNPLHKENDTHISNVFYLLFFPFYFIPEVFPSKYINYFTNSPTVLSSSFSISCITFGKAGTCFSTLFIFPKLMQLVLLFALLCHSHTLPPQQLQH